PGKLSVMPDRRRPAVGLPCIPVFRAARWRAHRGVISRNGVGKTGFNSNSQPRVVIVGIAPLAPSLGQMKERALADRPALRVVGAEVFPYGCAVVVQGHCASLCMLEADGQPQAVAVLIAGLVGPRSDDVVQAAPGVAPVNAKQLATGAPAV